MVQEQIAKIERERDTAPTPCEATERKRRLLLQLKSIGPAISALLSREVYYRQFANRRQVGSFLGLAPSPYNSGAEERCQGISRAGSGHVRAIMIEAAWLWIRHQPKSALTRWFVLRTAGQGTRVRKIMIVAVARKSRLPFGVTSNTAWCHKARSSTHQRRGTQDDRLTVPTLLWVERWAGRMRGWRNPSQIWPRQSAVVKMSPVLLARLSVHAAEWQAVTELPDIR